MDHIEFRRERRTAVDDEEKSYNYEVLCASINGRPLEVIWAEASRSSTMGAALSVAEVLRDDGDLWGPTPPDDPELVLEDGRVAVLTCSCGFFGCGGAVARISFEPRVVRWSEFGYGNDIDEEVAGPPPIGPYSFDRAIYESGLVRLTG